MPVAYDPHPIMSTAVETLPPRRAMPAQSTESPAKKQSKWSPEEDELIIALRGSGMKWDDISKRLPGRSAISCRLHYQNYLERRSEWDEERKNKLARLYERFKPDMWAKVAEELQVPWRAAEAMHWQLGEQDMARRAGVTAPFSLSSQETSQFGVMGHPQSRRSSPTRGHAHSQSHGSIPASHFPRMPMLAPLSMQGQPPLLPPSVPPGGRVLGPTPGQPVSPHHHFPRDSLDFGRGYGPTGPGPLGPPNMPGPGLGPPPAAPIAPLHAPGQLGRSGGYLPSVTELTTGISPYSTPAYSTGPFPGPSSGASAERSSLPPLTGSTAFEAPDDQSRSKRRGSPSDGSRDPVRRRHHDPRYDGTS